MTQQRLINREWRAQNDSTRYPFSSAAELTSRDGRVLIEGTFLDAFLYPVGGREGMYLSRVTLTHQQVTVWVGDADTETRCSGTFDLIRPDGLVRLIDALGRPAGVLVSEPARLGIFQSWGVGDHTFARAASEFCCSCCVPTPEVGLRGLRLPDGTVVTGEVWLVGDDGVVLRTEQEVVGGRAVTVVRVDVVGDPLFRRRLCEPDDLFITPSFVKTLRIRHAGGEFDCAPDEYGNVRIAENGSTGVATVLRVRATADGLTISMAGKGGD